MPPRRVQRHRDIEDLYRREEAAQMEQRINEKFNEESEKLDRIERMMAELNQNRRRVSPESSHGGNRISPTNPERRRVSPQSDRDHGNVEDRDRRRVDDRDRRDVGGRNRYGSRDVGGRDYGDRDRHRYATNFDEDYD